MPAGSGPSGLGKPAFTSANGSNGGVLARNLSPEKRRSRGGQTAAVGGGDIEMAKAGRGGDGEGEGYTPYSSGRMLSIGSSEAFDVEDANQRIAPPKVG